MIKREFGTKVCGVGWAFDKPPRPCQERMIEEIINHHASRDPRPLCLEAPTGTGKSPVNVSLANHWGGIILTPYNALQDQYARDWPWLPLLKGSANYGCTEHKGLTCKQGRAVRDRCRNDGCPYGVAKSRLLGSSAAMTNYAMLLTDSLEFEHPYLFCDEGHRLHDAVISAHTFAMKQKDCSKLGIRWFGPPDDETRLEEFLQRWVNVLESRADSTDNPDVKSTCSQLQDGALALLAALSRGEPVATSHEPKMGTFAIQPIFCGNLWQELWKSMCSPRLVLSSATFLDPAYVGSWLGTEPAMVRMDSPFPVETRPFVYRPACNVKANDEASLAAVTRAVERIMDEWADERGVVHVPSYKMGKYVSDSLRRDLRERLTTVDRDSTKEERESLIERHAAKPASVLLGPNMMEGFDLTGDLGRFNVLTKVPFPNMMDPWVRGKKEMDPRWLNWNVTAQLVQASGRVTRSSSDWGMTYLLDENFGWFFSRNEALFPQWFKDAMMEDVR